MPAFLAWSVIKAFLGGAFGKLWTWLSHRSFWQLVCMGLAIFAAVQHFEISHARAEAAKWQKQFSAEHTARLTDRKTYQQAQADAATANKAQVAKAEQQSKKVSDDERQAYLDDLAKLRADRMRQQASAAPGSSRPANPSQASGPAAGVDGNGLPLSGADNVQEKAAEIELRLMHLQNWVEQQLAIDPNK